MPLIAVIAIAGCSTSPYEVFKKATGVAVPECCSVTTIDTRGGFHGDGELIYQFHLDEKNGQAFESTVKTAEHWQSLPMTATLDELVYEHFNSKIPRAENGYYFFYDQQNNSHSVPDGYLKSYSYDFVVGMYDTETLTVYYYEQHT